MTNALYYHFANGIVSQVYSYLVTTHHTDADEYNKRYPTVEVNGKSSGSSQAGTRGEKAVVGSNPR